jgi:predicted AlkP superfamily pyrophosphatase or phosphodiesterase
MYINTLEEIKTNSVLKGLVTPSYEKYSLVNLISSVLQNFGVEAPHNPISELSNLQQKEKVVLLVIDAMGFNLLKYATKRIPLSGLERIQKEGILMPITSVFPSTTAVALPTISTGLTPIEHGLLGYRFYAREYGFLINSLFGKPANCKHCKLTIDTNWYLPVKTVGERLREVNIDSYIVTNINYLNSHFEKSLYRGFKELPYLTSSDMFYHVSNLLKETTGPTLILVYWWAIDALSHRYGPYSEAVLNEIAELDLLLSRLIKILDKNTTLIITADHGQIVSSPDKNIELSSFGELSSLFLMPVSDLRAPYIYTKDPNRVKELFKNFSNITALTREEALNLGLFGNKTLNNAFKSRIGDIVLIIKDDKNYSYLSPLEEVNLIGKHGGFSEDEMLVPLFVYNV